MSTLQANMSLDWVTLLDFYRETAAEWTPPLPSAASITQLTPTIIDFLLTICISPHYKV